MPVIDSPKLALSMNVYLTPKQMLADIYNISNVVQPAATFTAVARVGIATVLCWGVQLCFRASAPYSGVTSNS